MRIICLIIVHQKTYKQLVLYALTKLISIQVNDKVLDRYLWQATRLCWTPGQPHSQLCTWTGRYPLKRLRGWTDWLVRHDRQSQSRPGLSAVCPLWTSEQLALACLDIGRERECTTSSASVVSFQPDKSNHWLFSFPILLYCYDLSIQNLLENNTFMIFQFRIY